MRRIRPPFIGTAAGGGGKTATVAATLPSLTASANAAVQRDVTVAATLPALTASAAASVQRDVTVSATLPSLTASIAATVSRAVTVAATLPSMVASVASTVARSVSVAATLPSLTASVSAALARTVTVAATLPALTATATASIERDVSVSATLPALTASVSATVQRGVSVAATLPALTASVNAALGSEVSASVAATLPSLTSSVAATLSRDVTVAATLPSLTADINAVVARDVSVAATLPALTANANAVVGAGITASVAATLPALTSSVAATVARDVSVAATLPALTASATVIAPKDVTGVVSAALPALTASITVSGRAATTPLGRLFNPFVWAAELIDKTAGVTEALRSVRSKWDEGDLGSGSSILGQVLTSDGNGASTWETPKSYSQIALSAYDAEPARSAESNLHGGLLSLATGSALNSGSPINVTKGIGKLLISINAGSDFTGTITITGTSVDRETGATTPADTDSIDIDALTTDSSDTDGNGNVRHGFSDAYISSKWFTGSVTLSTADLTLTDVDVYHVSFEQFNDNANYTIETFDINVYTTNVSAEIDAYLYSLKVTGSKCTIIREADLNVGTNGETAIANRYWRLRKGNITKQMNGATDGIWVDVFYSNSPAYVEDCTIKVWADLVI